MTVRKVEHNNKKKEIIRKRKSPIRKKKSQNTYLNVISTLFETSA